MATSQRVDILLPPGRIVQGDLYTANTTDNKGQPLKVKKGPNAGQPRIDYFFALAIPKQPGQTHWATPVFPPGIVDGQPEAEVYKWGYKIWCAGAAGFPNHYQRDDFAWKIIDGDSIRPNKENRRPCDYEGHPGHWVLRLSGGYAPKVYQRDSKGVPQAAPAGFVKRGYYVQASVNVSPNDGETPGVYMNHDMVLFLGYGAEISSGPDAATVFAAATTALPAGASAVPLGVASLPAAPVAPVAGLPAPAPAALPPMAATPPAPVVVTPHPQFLAGPPPAPAAPGVPAAPAAPLPPARQMTALAQGATYESFVSKGWTDALLVQHGYMLA